MKSRIFMLISLMALYACQSQIPRPFSETSNLVEDNLSDATPTPEETGLIIYDPATKKILQQQSPHTAFIPASTTKIITAIAALAHLGPKFRFTTKLKYRGQIKQNILHGNLWLQGNGDPLLKFSHLMQMVQEMRRKGIQKVAGDFIYDDRLLPNKQMIDEARDYLASFNPPISALSAEFNVLFDRNYLPFFASVMRATDSLENTENIQRQIVFPFPVKDAGLFTAKILQFLAQLNGIQIPEPQAAAHYLSPLSSHSPHPQKKNSRKTLSTHRSLPLVEIIDVNLEYSNNLMAEILMLSTARKMSHKKLNFTQSAQKIESWVKRKILGPDQEGFVYQNGSGLGPYNFITPWQMIKILQYGEKLKLSTDTGKIHGITSLLPIAGIKGTLLNRFNSPALFGRIWAKTGHQSYGRSLAGALFTQSGKKYLFAILSCHFSARKEWDLKVDEQSAQETRAAARWGQKIKRFETKILNQYVQSF